MKLPTPIPIPELIDLGQFKSNIKLNHVPAPIVPGSNPWIKYVIVGGIILLAFFIAYQITKPLNYERRKKALTA